MLTWNFLPVQLFGGYRPGQSNFQVMYTTVNGTVNEVTGISFKMYLIVATNYLRGTLPT